MSIQRIPFTPSPGLRKELEFFTTTDQGRKIYSEIKGADDLVSLIETNSDYVDLKTLMKRFPPGKLLDVGVGWGLTSAYWGVQGYAVTCLDPSPEACHSMEEFFNRLGLQNTIFCGPAEALDYIPGDFDYVVFWSSLHHCDDPARAINNAYKILRPGGWIILLETQGTGFETPHPPAHLQEYYAYLQKVGFASDWFRTDYRFESVQEAVELSTFFFGIELGNQVLAINSPILPECTGIWWKRV
jgi:ubiquinone/menaquinone biosynthesis C-methylase UbiE